MPSDKSTCIFCEGECTCHGSKRRKGLTTAGKVSPPQTTPPPAPVPPSLPKLTLSTYVPTEAVTLPPSKIASVGQLRPPTPGPAEALFDSPTPPPASTKKYVQPPQLDSRSKLSLTPASVEQTAEDVDFEASIRALAPILAVEERNQYSMILWSEPSLEVRREMFRRLRTERLGSATIQEVTGSDPDQSEPNRLG